MSYNISSGKYTEIKLQQRQKEKEAEQIEMSKKEYCVHCSACAFVCYST